MDKKDEMTNEQKLIRGIEFEEEKQPIKREDITTEAGLIRGIEFEENPDLDKEYLICFKYGTDEEGEVNDWKLIAGRKNLYKFIKDMIETMDIDESFIVADKTALEKRISVYDFMKLVIEGQNLYPDDNFNIDDYR